MKKILLGTIVLTLGLGLTGCGSNSPEDVAKTFASSLSSANMNEAKSVASEEVQKKLKRLSSICNQKVVKKLTDETIVVLNDIEKKSKDKKYDAQLKDMLSQFEKDTVTIQGEIKQDIISKYGSPKNIPEELREKLMNEALEKMVELTNPLVEKQFEIFDIKTEHPDRVKRIIAKFMYKGGMGTRVNRRNLYVLEGIVGDIVAESQEKITLQCIDKYTEFGLVDDINVIETKQDSPDSANVRLELIRDDGKSKKVSVEVEKIKDEWKISDLYLDTFF